MSTFPTYKQTSRTPPPHTRCGRPHGKPPPRTSYLLPNASDTRASTPLLPPAPLLPLTHCFHQQRRPTMPRDAEAHQPTTPASKSSRRVPVLSHSATIARRSHTPAFPRAHRRDCAITRAPTRHPLRSAHPLPGPHPRGLEFPPAPTRQRFPRQRRRRCCCRRAGGGSASA